MRKTIRVVNRRLASHGMKFRVHRKGNGDMRSIKGECLQLSEKALDVLCFFS